MLFSAPKHANEPKFRHQQKVADTLWARQQKVDGTLWCGG